jgi:carbon monoxide dehydrogenase subunit G
VWDFLMDIPAVSQCVPGIERVEEIDEDNYAGTLHVRVGPISVRLEGRVTVLARNSDERRASGRVEAVDRRIRGAVNAVSTMHLEPNGEDATDLVIHTDASVLGKLGEFGQPVMRRKADQILAEFARNMARQIETHQAPVEG